MRLLKFQHFTSASEPETHALTATQKRVQSGSLLFKARCIGVARGRTGSNGWDGIGDGDGMGMANGRGRQRSLTRVGGREAEGLMSSIGGEWCREGTPKARPVGPLTALVQIQVANHRIPLSLIRSERDFTGAGESAGI